MLSKDKSQTDDSDNNHPSQNWLILFIKRCFSRPAYQFLSLLLLFVFASIIVFSLFNILPLILGNKNFQVLSASSYQQNNTIVVDANLQIDFTEDVVEALENGIPLIIAVEVQVFHETSWWRNQLVKESRQLFELRYHPLTNIHEVKNLANNERYSFNSRHDAMFVLGTIQGAELIDKKLLDKKKQYFVQIRTLLDISQLPAALRQVAAVSSSWRLESLWYRWPITYKSSKTQKIKNRAKSAQKLKKESKKSPQKALLEDQGP